MRGKLLFVVVSVLVLVCGIHAQKKAKLGKVCGDPTAVCKSGESFQSYDLPFDLGNNFVIYESERFYGIVLRSKKLKADDWGDCEHPSFGEQERLEIQKLFSHNKVFAMNCSDTGMNYYTGVADHTVFIGVYGGRTLAEANKFLKTVKATGKFPGIRVRRLQIGINGT